MRVSKARKELITKAKNSNTVDIQSAIADIKALHYVKFNESIDLSIDLSIDPKKQEQNIRGYVVLPNGTGSKKKILALCKSGDEQSCLNAGADYAGGDDYIEKIKGGWCDFDIIVTISTMMGKLGLLGKILGPKGLMPNPKTGGVAINSESLLKSITEAKGGRVEIRNDKYGIVHNSIGKISFDNEKLVENFKTYISALMKMKPASTKGIFIRKINLSSTMGVNYVINSTI